MQKEKAMGSKVSACIKAVKVWIAANKVTAGILAGVIVAGGGAAVALGAGILPQDHLLIGGVCMLLGLGAILRSLSAASSHETNG